MINYYMNIDKCRNKPPNLSYYDNSFNKKKKTDLLVNINNIKNRHHQKKNYKLFFQRGEFTRDNNNYRNNRNEDNSLKHMDSCHTMYFKNQKLSTLRNELFGLKGLKKKIVFFPLKKENVLLKIKKNHF